MNQTTDRTDGSYSPSVLRSLRDLMPPRLLTYQEAIQRAEIQAARFLALTGVRSLLVPVEAVTDLPKIEVVLTSRLPLSGSAHWEEGRWVIYLSESDHPTRQRFSLMHEYKHIVDHALGDYVERPALRRGQKRSAEGLEADHFGQYERIADHFAASVLMPKSKVKSTFCSGEQDIDNLAGLFGVSPKAMRFRISQLGLISEVQRCGGLPARTSSHGGSRFRSVTARPTFQSVRYQPIPAGGTS